LGVIDYYIVARCFFFAGDSPPHPSGRPVRLTFNLIYFIEQPGSNAHRQLLLHCSNTHIHVGVHGLRTFPAHPVPTAAEKQNDFSATYASVVIDTVLLMAKAQYKTSSSHSEIVFEVIDG
jgi:hypothetical protein